MSASAITNQIVYRQGLRHAALRIKKAKHIHLFCHRAPDGDTIGSALGLACALTKMGKSFEILCPDPPMARFGYLTYSECFSSNALKKADLAIALDVASVSQLGELYDVFRRSAHTLRVDHHEELGEFARDQLVDAEAAATGEVVYDLIQALKVPVDSSIAQCLLSAIFVDTGGLRFSNLRSKTLAICADLSRYDVDLPGLMEAAYHTRSRACVMLSSICLSKAIFTDKGRMAYSVASQSMFRRYKAMMEDVDTVPDQLRSIDGVWVSAFFRQTPKGNWRVSLRAKPGLDVAAVAREFGGGGHKQSAGLSYKRHETLTRQKLMRALKKLVHD